MSNKKKKEHKVQIIAKEIRYICVEHEGKVTFSRDGDAAGHAKWQDDQFIGSTAVLPDEVIMQMERLIKEAIAADYFD